MYCRRWSMTNRVFPGCGPRSSSRTLPTVTVAPSVVAATLMPRRPCLWTSTTGSPAPPWPSRTVSTGGGRGQLLSRQLAVAVRVEQFEQPGVEGGGGAVSTAQPAGEGVQVDDVGAATALRADLEGRQATIAVIRGQLGPGHLAIAEAG